MKRYLEVAYTVETGQAAEPALDRLVGEVWGVGALGCRLSDDGFGLVAYFADDGGDPTAGVRLPAGVRELRRQRIVEEDWLGRYRRSVAPIEVGKRWLLDPRDADNDEPAAGGMRTVLRLPARRAFGTGGHESTRLALRLLETTELAGLRVLDLGYGSGVLAFAAAHGGARTVLAVERDLTAALVGSRNRALNPTPVPVSMIAGSVEALAPVATIDVLTVNARPKSWLPSARSLDRCLVEGASVLCSGMLVGEVDDLERDLGALGWESIEHIGENDWRALRLKVDR